MKASVLTRFALAASMLVCGALLPGGAHMMRASNISPVDRTFVTNAAKAGVEEVQQAQLERNSDSADARAFAQRMIRDHGRNNAQLKSLAHTLGLSSRVRQGVESAAAPKAMPGPVYLRKEVGDHEQVIALFEREVNHGSNPQLKAFARQTIPILRTHLLLAQHYSGSK